MTEKEKELAQEIEKLTTEVGTITEKHKDLDVSSVSRSKVQPLTEIIF